MMIDIAVSFVVGVAFTGLFMALCYFCYLRGFNAGKTHMLAMFKAHVQQQSESMKQAAEEMKKRQQAEISTARKDLQA